MYKLLLEAVIVVMNKGVGIPSRMFLSKRDFITLSVLF